MPNLWIFISALVVVYLLPGADMILLLQTGATEGRAHAIATALGLARVMLGVAGSLPVAWALIVLITEFAV